MISVYSQSMQCSQDSAVVSTRGAVPSLFGAIQNSRSVDFRLSQLEGYSTEIGIGYCCSCTTTNCINSELHLVQTNTTYKYFTVPVHRAMCIA
ncbi:hypothetical protein Plhal304r1_c025g0084111 [Plasmopara halstedii]